MSVDIDFDNNIDVRPVFMRKLMNGHGVSPLTAAENSIIQSYKELLTIEEENKEELGGTLLSFLAKMEPYVSYRDTLFFLLDCYDNDDVELAIETLLYAFETQTRLDATNLMEIINDNTDKGIAPSLLVHIVGSPVYLDELEKEELAEIAEKQVNLNDQLNNSNFNSSTFTPVKKTQKDLNISAMNDFLNNK